jgi:predicted ATP-grasp superfamily ATP-dependent carboligase
MTSFHEHAATNLHVPGDAPQARGRPSADGQPVRLVLTEDAPAYGVLAGLRALRAAGHEVWLAVTDAGSYGALSRAAAGRAIVPRPDADPSGYVSAVSELAARVGAAAVLPGTERALVALAGQERRFKDGVALGTCPPDIVRLATDKSRLEGLVAEVGLRVPPTWTLSRGELASPPDFPYPVIVKALRPGAPGSHQPPVRRVEGLAELRRAVDAMPGDHWLVQPYVSGDLAAVSGVSWCGELICAAHQRAHRIYPPDCGISASAATIAPDAEVEDAVARLLRLIGWSGVFQLQFLETPEGRYVIDLNPRMYGSMALAVAAGLNLPAIWVELLLGGRPVPAGYRPGVRFRSEERDAGAIAAAATSRDWSTALGALVPRRGTVHAVFSLRDPLPAVRSVRQLAKAPALIRRGHRRD